MNTVKELKDRLFCKKNNVYSIINEEEFNRSQIFAENYKTFLNKSKTERETVSFCVSFAEEKGFRECKKGSIYNSGDKIYKINRNKSVVFAVIGEQGCKNGFNLVASHIDAPRLDLKPNPLYEKNDLAWMKTHYYGGIKKYQWTSLPLSLHGRIFLKNGSHIDVCIGEDETDPCFYVSDLLPHLSREQMSKPASKLIDGENLNILVGSLPFKDDKESDLVKLNILNILNEKYGIIESDLSSSELELVPCFKARDIGFDRGLIGSYGHDDRSCAYPSFMSLMDLDIPSKTCVVILADKEEIGSEGNTGMQSSFFRYFLSDLAEMENLKPRDILSSSKALSADVDAAYDPNYSSSFDELNSSFLNKGVVITKYTGHSGKSGASDCSAEFLGYLRQIFEKNNVIFQFGQLGKVDTGGGGTVAKYIANLNIDVVDVGVPVLSMHSPFEVIAKLDLYELFKAVGVFFKN